MDFSDVLNYYINILNCSSKELSDASGISASTISRYRNRERIPSYESDQFNKLISGIVNIADLKGITNINANEVKNKFSNAFGKNIIDFDLTRKNLNILISRFKH